MKTTNFNMDPAESSYVIETYQKLEIINKVNIKSSHTKRLQRMKWITCVKVTVRRKKYQY